MKSQYRSSIFNENLTFESGCAISIKYIPDYSY